MAPTMYLTSSDLKSEIDAVYCTKRVSQYRMHSIAMAMFVLMLALWSHDRQSVVTSLAVSSTPKRIDKKNPRSSTREHEMEVSRRSYMTTSAASAACLVVSGATASGVKFNSVRRHNDIDFQGTSLPLLSLDEASTMSFSIEHAPEGTLEHQQIFPFAQWPDPLLRRPARRVSIPPDNAQEAVAQKKTRLAAKLQSIARILQKTAHEKRAVGLAAQQCGIDVSMAYLDDHREKHNSVCGSFFKKWWSYMVGRSSDKNDAGRGIFLLNPRIVNRSREAEMRVWTEECLVLPPWFRATVLRDAWVTIEYESIFDDDDDDDGSSLFVTKQVTLYGEVARAAQHEMQHDEGILILDHVDLTDLPAFMQDHEAQGHNERMQLFVTKQVTLYGEVARAAQHEMQHDEGILILDHVDLTDLPAFMQDHEAQGHNERMQRAFSRAVMVPSASSATTTGGAPSSGNSSTTRSFWNEAIVPKANAAVVVVDNNVVHVSVVATRENAAASTCNEACLAERTRIIEQRRAMMRQSRSNTNREEVFRLSQQRAALIYNTTYQGAQCLPGVPCI
jgi:peptide deformylase